MSRASFSLTLFNIIVLNMIISVVAFTQNTSHSTRSNIQIIHVKSRENSLKSSPFLHKNYQQEIKLQMVENETKNSNNDDDIPKLPNKSKSSGIVTALVMGPPLIAKLLIVLTVKFMTDVIVFPMLWLYRLVKKIAVRTKILFGSSSRRSRNSNSKLNEEEDMKATVVSSI